MIDGVILVNRYVLLFCCILFSDFNLLSGYSFWWSFNMHHKVTHNTTYNLRSTFSGIFRHITQFTINNKKTEILNYNSNNINLHRNWLYNCMIMIKVIKILKLWESVTYYTICFYNSIHVIVIVARRSLSNLFF